ncbi:hypothetical protein ASU31_01005 [Pedobacter ginsenosidimutans]|uniref:Dienelactone hydrolase domain-containing protein n=2 Tax=Pedobacter ginsenosidimutans TaxID=687842 RepID=A0A0T5VVR4_9SPHI|nr:hypothetical protein ASU31_01005 [Pedobacter ginsenosidimutans]
MSRTEADRLAMQQWNTEKQKLMTAARKVWNEGVIKFQQYQMAIAYKVFGTKPVGGRSLYISLHGGGNAPVAVNDQQWENQRTLYNIKEGLVIVPRAPTNTWNLWHEDHIDNFIDSLIRYSVIMEDVNPDKVYILGYSAGGDGVFQLAPRMADRFAAASMMAGHPGDADMRNLRNLPFSIFIGGLDSAYNRNKLAIKYNRKLDSLHNLDAKGYDHEFHLYPDKPHWLDHQDTIAIPWMADYKRNTFPDKVVWVQDNRLQHRFYWLSAPLVSSKVGDAAEVSRKGNQITILHNTFKVLEINLNDDLVNLDQPVTVIANGKVLFHKKVNRSFKAIERAVKEYQDPRFIFTTELLLSNNKVSEVYPLKSK